MCMMSSWTYVILEQKHPLPILNAYCPLPIYFALRDTVVLASNYIIIIIIIGSSSDNNIRFFLW